ncbi:MAG TPA: amidohydrolase family protein [Thermomicrobiaceae bacterium]|nr:amidohydrolase family protein [Thermomicrobiaceae bacterium]
MSALPSGPIDMHAHYVARSSLGIPGVSMEERGDEIALTVQGESHGTLPKGLFDPATQLADMHAAGVAHAVISPPPFLFCYDVERGFGAEFAAAQNAGIAALVREHPESFSGLGTVPLQDPELAARMLGEAVEDLGLAGVEIGTNVAGRDLDDPMFEPFWRRAAELGVLVFIHPSDVRSVPGNAPYYLRNLNGNLIETGYCLSRLVYSGLLARYPSLRILGAHGGGFLPYTVGRLDHGYRVRPECAAALEQPPSAYFHQLYFDTITHGAPALRYLVDLVGADHVALGSDYPFDMGDPRPVGQVEALADPAAREQLASSTPRHLLRHAAGAGA